MFSRVWWWGAEFAGLGVGGRARVGEGLRLTQGVMRAATGAQQLRLTRLGVRHIQTPATAGVPRAAVAFALSANCCGVLCGARVPALCCTVCDTCRVAAFLLLPLATTFCISAAVEYWKNACFVFLCVCLACGNRLIFRPYFGPSCCVSHMLLCNQAACVTPR